MKKLAVAVLVIIMLSGSAIAIHDYYVRDPPFEGYTGERARERRLYDPFSRDRYFGVDSYKPYSNYGQKGPTYRVTNTGAKSAYSGVFQLDTSAYIPRGRDPSKISNKDPGMRGYNIVDIPVELLPYSPLEQSIGLLSVRAKGTARIVSRGDFYGAGLNKPFPRTQVFIEAINLPPIEPNMAYEAWLFDDDSEYSVNLGMLDIVTELTLGLTYENTFLSYFFDRVIITREAYPDLNPGPGEIILEGKIEQGRLITKPTSFIFQRLR